MRRTLILGAVVATGLTLGLGVGATLAAGNPVLPTPIGSVQMTDNRMHDVDDMIAMMNAGGTSNMMEEDAMLAMHTAMHPTDAPSHAAHHMGSQP